MVLLVRIILWYPLSTSHPFSPQKSFPPSPKNCKSEILGPFGPRKSTETAQGSLSVAKFSFYMFNICFIWLKLWLCGLNQKRAINPKALWLTHIGAMTHTSRILGPTFPLNSPKYHLGSCIILDGQNHVTEASIFSSTQSSPQVYLTHSKGLQITYLGPLRLASEPQNCQKYLLYCCIFISVTVDGITVDG